MYKSAPECEKFVKRNEGKPVSDFLKDAVRFNYKVFAQAVASKLAEKIYYVDSDSVFIQKIPYEWYEECLPDDVFVSFYHRPQQFTETGFVAFNNKLPVAEKFYEEYTGLYINDTVYGLTNWTDCHTLDYTRLKMKKNWDYLINLWSCT